MSPLKSMTAPVFAACMTICLIGLTGLPPTSGFVGKFYIFKEVFAYSGNGSLNVVSWRLIQATK